MRLHQLLNHIELILSGVGLIVILIVPWLTSQAISDTWRVAAITAILVGLLHGRIFWVIRRRHLHHISDESLTTWEQKYEHVLSKTPVTRSQ